MHIYFALVCHPLQCLATAPEDTIEHYLLICGLHRKARRQLENAVATYGIDPLKVRDLLGGGESGDFPQTQSAHLQ
jgi:hypothetical protein